MYFIRIESFVFSDLSHCTNTLPGCAEIELFISVLWLELRTGGSKSSWEANLSSGRCINTREGHHCR